MELCQCRWVEPTALSLGTLSSGGNNQNILKHSIFCKWLRKTSLKIHYNVSNQIRNGIKPLKLDKSTKTTIFIIFYNYLTQINL